MSGWSILLQDSTALASSPMAPLESLDEHGGTCHIYTDLATLFGFALQDAAFVPIDLLATEVRRVKGDCCRRS